MIVKTDCRTRPASLLAQGVDARGRQL